jgi:peptide/nickel transport system substrate-binding protein
MSRRALLVGSLGAGASTLALSACESLDRLGALRARGTPTGTPQGAAPRSGGILRISKPGDIVPAGAPFVLTSSNIHLFTLLYDTLVSYDTNFTPRPRLATSWQWSPDSRRLTLNIRSDVKFHTGRPFTSDDAKFNLEHLRDPSVGSTWRNYANLMHISAPDPGTLLIDYDTPVKSSFDALAWTFMADSQTLDQTNTGRAFVGTGPFRFQEWVQSDHLTVTRNSDYWQPGRPYLDKVELDIMTDPQSGVVALESGSVEWMSGVPGPAARRLQDDPTYQVMLTANGGTYFYVGMDLTVPALADKRVRQALSYALNRQRMVDTALSGFGRPASILWPRQSAAYDPTQDQTYTFDLTKARQLLDAASWDSNTIVPLYLGNLIALNVPMAEIYQADLASIGVKLDVQRVENGDFVSRILNGKFDGTWMTSMAFMNLSPATFLSSAAPVRLPNTSHFDNQRYRDLIDQANVETDEQKLRALLHEVTQIMLDEAWVAPIAESATTTTGPEVARSSVRNATWDPLGLFAYQDIWLDS